MDEPIIAYRVWRLLPVAPDSHRLMSWANSRLEWPTHRLDAECKCHEYGYDPLDEPHTAPAEECSCGIYGFKTLELTADHMAGGHQLLVAGRVGMWGRIVECERGYRAQYAYPQVFYYSPGNEDIVRGMSQRYQVDCLPLPEDLRATIAIRGDLYTQISAAVVARAQQSTYTVVSQPIDNYGQTVTVTTWVPRPAQPEPAKSTSLFQFWMEKIKKAWQK